MRRIWVLEKNTGLCGSKLNWDYMKFTLKTLSDPSKFLSQKNKHMRAELVKCWHWNNVGRQPWHIKYQTCSLVSRISWKSQVPQRIDSTPRIYSGQGALLLSVQIVKEMLHPECVVQSRCSIDYGRNSDLGLGRCHKATWKAARASISCIFHSRHSLCV